ncbi:MAG: thiamine pyrophosphate-binding protein [Deltaproteobacteria bacterium]|nr:thiamine pyrophosphate-binding protein [Deltaproteobacteria bacterium]
MDGGERIARVLAAQGVEFLFTLCGGHISPILAGAKAQGIRVVDVRHEVNAVFAADAVARLTGTPGVAAVTAGPGVTNTITAVKNAQMAQSPVVVLGGATATLLKGRGSLQDIDQLALFAPHVKWATTVSTVRGLIKTIERALLVAQAGVPGPVFVECPVDLLYSESVVRSLYPFQGESQRPRGWRQQVQAFFVGRHLRRLFAGAEKTRFDARRRVAAPEPTAAAVETAFSFLAQSQRPVLVVGSQVVQRPEAVEKVVEAIEALGVPTYLAGMARGLLGTDHPQQLRHKRKAALKEADLVILAGFPCDFRLDYGRSISSKAKLVSINRSSKDLKLNRRPSLGVHADPGIFLETLAAEIERDGDEWEDWQARLRERDVERNAEIAQQAAISTEYLNPVHLCQQVEEVLPEDSVLVADGGDFVGTAAYILQPRGPLRWLDPGPFGTLGVGAGFALGAKLTRPEAEVWILYGDGSAGYSLAEFDTFVRHGVPVIAIVGNDACWMQIYREQIEVLKDDVGCMLARTPYGQVVEGFGAKGLQLERPEDIPQVLRQAQDLARAGHPVLINALLGKTDFRKGSISM